MRSSGVPEQWDLVSELIQLNALLTRLETALCVTPEIRGGDHQAIGALAM